MSKKFISILTALLIVLSLGAQNIFAIGSNPSNSQYVKIGLFYGGSSQTTVKLSSKTGFRIMTVNDDYSQPVADILNKNNIIVKKDFTYHVQEGDTFSTASEAMAKLGNGSFVYYDGTFKVVRGSYKTLEEAQKTGLQVIDANKKLVIVTDENGNPLFAHSGDVEITIESVNDGKVKIADKEYRGGAMFKRLSNSDMTVINRLPIEEYLYGVVPKEMSGSWPIEALKAQSVCARNFTYKNMKKHKAQGFDLCSTVDCQAYGGVAIEHKNSTKAVDETRGKAIYYMDSLAEIYYHANSGGRTEDIENVWSKALPYMRGVKDDFSLGEKDSNWTVKLTSAQIKASLLQNKIDLGDILDVKIDQTTQNEHIMKLTVVGTKGQKTFEKEGFRRLFSSQLKSNYYTITKESQNQGQQLITGFSLKKGIETASASPDIFFDETNNNPQNNTLPSGTSDTYIFNGHGWGHGVGMSQLGAKNMASKGYSYIDIIKFYFTNVEVK